MACYSASTNEELSGIDPIVILRDDKEVQYFMNEAMKALWEVADSRGNAGSIARSGCGSKVETATNCLNACVNCDFSKPSIADLLKPIFFPAPKEKK
jgi:hypothetical protein